MGKPASWQKVVKVPASKQDAPKCSSCPSRVYLDIGLGPRQKNMCFFSAAFVGQSSTLHTAVVQKMSKEHVWKVGCGLNLCSLSGAPFSSSQKLKVDDEYLCQLSSWRPCVAPRFGQVWNVESLNRRNMFPSRGNFPIPSILFFALRNAAITSGPAWQ